MKNLAMRSVQLPHGTIRYRDEGTGEPLLFVHGLLVNGALWRKVTPTLTREFRCLVPEDQPAVLAELSTKFMRETKAAAPQTSAVMGDFAREVSP